VRGKNVEVLKVVVAEAEAGAESMFQRLGGALPMLSSEHQSSYRKRPIMALDQKL